MTVASGIGEPEKAAIRKTDPRRALRGRETPRLDRAARRSAPSMRLNSASLDRGAVRIAREGSKRLSGRPSAGAAEIGRSNHDPDRQWGS